MSEEKRKILLVNAGRCILSNHKEGYKFIEVTSEEFDAGTLPNDKSNWVFDKKVNKYLGRSPGMVFEINIEINSALLATAQYQGLWPNKNQRARWDIEHKTLGQQFRLKAQKKKDERLNAFEYRLEPLRDAYRNARGLQRSLILAHIVRFITS